MRRTLSSITPSTKRALRTAFQAGLALVTWLLAVYTVLKGVQGLSMPEQLATYAAWLGVVTKAHNALEDAGLIPAWLKEDPQ